MRLYQTPTAASIRAGIPTPSVVAVAICASRLSPPVPPVSGRLLELGVETVLEVEVVGVGTDCGVELVGEILDPSVEASVFGGSVGWLVVSELED